MDTWMARPGRRRRARRPTSPGPAAELVAAAVLALLAMVPAGCRNANVNDEVTATEPDAEASFDVVVSAPALLDLTRTIARDTDVSVIGLGPADADGAEDWSPDRAALRTMLGADVLVLQGAGHEPWASAANLPLSRTVTVADEHRSEWIPRRGARTHGHGPGGPDSAAPPTPETWLAPDLARRAVDTIERTLVEALPELAPSLTAGADDGRQRLDRIDATLRAASVTLGDRPVILADDAAGYVARGRAWRATTVPLDGRGPWTEAASGGVQAALGDPSAAGRGPVRAVGLVIFTRRPSDEVIDALRSRHGLIAVTIPAPGDDPWLVRFAAGAEAVAAAADALGSAD